MPTTETTSVFPAYYNRFQAAGRWVDLRFLASNALQSAELNELQSLLRHQIRSIGDAAFREGAVIDGSVPQIVGISSDSPNFAVDDGVIYFSGAANVVDGLQMTIPFDSKVSVGIRYREIEINDEDDSGLLDPAVECSNYQEPGAARRQAQWHWGWTDDHSPVRNDDTYTEEWTFYPIYVVDHGVILVKNPPPIADPVLQLIAMYDREAHGNYIDFGLVASFVETTTDPDNDDEPAYRFNLSKGKANILGFKYSLVADTRLLFAIDPDVQAIEDEPHVFHADGDGKYLMFTNRNPIAEVSRLIGAVEKTVTLTKGVLNSADELPDATVLTITEVTKGVTTYVAGRDYILAGDTIDWSPSTGGAIEPSPGDSYDVTYNYNLNITPGGAHDFYVEAVNLDHLIISGLVEGSTIEIDYTYKLPRVDRIVLNQNGTVTRIVGVAQRRNPAPPTPAASQIAIAQIQYDWVSDPYVVNDGVRTTTMAAQQSMQKDIVSLFDLIAQQRLLNQINSSDASSKLGVFVDPFTNDDLRDTGLTQTAAIVNSTLQLPVAASTANPNHANNNSLWTLPFTTSALIEQGARTGSTPINPYAAFEPLPARLVLDPPYDFYTLVQSIWASPVTEAFMEWDRRHRNFVVQSTVRVTTEVSDTAFMRVRTVNFTVDGFGPTESLVRMTFDRVVITPAGPLVADGDGHIAGSFTVPANTPVGTKMVTVLGSGGTTGQATYTATSRVETNTLQQYTLWRIGVDPLAQTFTVSEPRIIAGIQVRFTARGNLASPVYAQIREVANGVPTSNVIGEGRIMPSSFVLTGGYATGWTTITFGVPVPLEANKEYAIVLLTDDSTHAVAFAELAKYVVAGEGPKEGWVTQQAYQVGEFLTSSNASTWTTNPTKDLTFRLMACNFTSNTRTVALGDVSMTGITDFMMRSAVIRPGSGCDAEFRITNADDGETHTVLEGQDIPYTAAKTTTASVELLLSGSSTMSPIVLPHSQAILGVMNGTGTYIGRAIDASVNFTMTVTLEAKTPGSATVTPYMQVQRMSSGSPVIVDGVYQYDWVEVPVNSLIAPKVTGDGFVERHFLLADQRGVGLDWQTRVKLVITGTPQSRPKVQNLRVVAR